MASNIQIVEKPDWISWDDIKQCLYEAHAVNRAKGINMTHYLWPAERIEESLGEGGEMLVALDGNRLIGTAAVADKIGKSWYANGHYAYVCFDAVHPDYAGKGIFKQLDAKREDLVRLKGYSVLIFDTNIKNTRRQKIALVQGYRYVRFFRGKNIDHYSVVMAKWINGCPYSKCYCYYRYQKSRLKTIFKFALSKLFRSHNG